MLNPELTQLNNIFNHKSTFSNNNIATDPIQFQYQLCQLFMKKTGHQLHKKQSEMIMSSQELIKKLKINKNQKDLWSTDSGGEETTVTSKQTAFSRQRMVSPLRSSAARKVESKLGGWMKQIEQSCSAMCIAKVRALLMDYQQVISEKQQMQVRQKQANRKYNHWQRLQEENVVLKKKLQSQNLKIDSLKLELQNANNKNQSMTDYANKKLQEAMTGHKFVEINARLYKQIKGYLEQKQKIATARVIRAQELQKELIEKLSTGVPQDQSCQNCCKMMKGLKQFLFKCKAHLQGETQQIDKLYLKVKKMLFVTKKAV